MTSLEYTQLLTAIVFLTILVSLIMVTPIKTRNSEIMYRLSEIEDRVEKLDNRTEVVGAFCQTDDGIYYWSDYGKWEKLTGKTLFQMRTVGLDYKQL